MSEHPIEGIMITAMNSIQDMIDVNTIIGEPIETSNNVVIIPISKVCVGFAVGGSEFKGETIDEYTKREKEEEIQYRLPFGGGSGAAVNINPMAFLVIQSNSVKLLPINHSSAMDKLLDYMPDLVEKANTIMNKAMQNKKEDNKNKEKLEQKIEQKVEQKVEQKLNNQSNIKTKPRRNREPRQHNTGTTYEIEYNQVENEPEMEEYEEFEDKQEYDD